MKTRELAYFTSTLKNHWLGAPGRKDSFSGPFWPAEYGEQTHRYWKLELGKRTLKQQSLRAMGGALRALKRLGPLSPVGVSAHRSPQSLFCTTVQLFLRSPPPCRKLHFPTAATSDVRMAGSLE